MIVPVMTSKSSSSSSRLLVLRVLIKSSGLFNYGKKLMKHDTIASVMVLTHLPLLMLACAVSVLWVYQVLLGL